MCPDQREGEGGAGRADAVQPLGGVGAPPEAVGPYGAGPDLFAVESAPPQAVVDPWLEGNEAYVEDVARLLEVADRRQARQRVRERVGVVLLSFAASVLVNLVGLSSQCAAELSAVFRMMLA
jgi:hypothetical protein